ncbi:hypothetical protein UMM65_05400 [Aureibaculum sp. 2210JD6-5]|uniref:hypothetical protein n=1 Tax=Aureibaculum sp. 2210JD6-5 TaxID=3103957 RepID=UPI002AADB9A4|nr:hypothetical protein [Aureibaculum sp. 2210JD6-5]MDY7394668.1 hypothetical protein [Aureibaculum sp. 2210JD6-5]
MKHFKLSESVFLIFDKTSLYITEGLEESKVVLLIESKNLKGVANYEYKDILEFVFIEENLDFEINFTSENFEDQYYTLDKSTFDNLKNYIINNLDGIDIAKLALYKQLYPYFLGLGTTGLFSYLIYVAAKAIENGNPIHGTGKLGLFKNLLNFFAGLLGTLGTIVFGSLISAILIYFIFKKVINPKNGTVIYLDHFPELKTSKKVQN